MEIISILCFAFVVYAYFGYPMVLYVLTGGGRANTYASSEPFLPSVSLIITVYNEEGVIEKKIRESLELDYDGDLEIIVASDCSTDKTHEIVAQFPEVKLLCLETRGGKETAQKKAVELARGDIIVFSDAKISLETKVLEKFVRYFSDAEVGAVSSIDRVLQLDGSQSGEGFYVRYEMWLRSLESAFNSLVGLSGSCFAVRASIAEKIVTDIPSDFALLLETRRQGLRGVHAPDVVASYSAVRTEREEFSRKVRTVLRGITTLMARSEVMNPLRFGIFSWQIVSHKLLRWLVPFFLILGSATAMSAATHSPLMALITLSVIVGMVLAAIPLFRRDLQDNILFKVPLFFIVVNSAIFVAWTKYLSGQRSTYWTPSKKV